MNVQPNQNYKAESVKVGEIKKWYFVLLVRLQGGRDEGIFDLWIRSKYMPTLSQIYIDIN